MPDIFHESKRDPGAEAAEAAEQQAKALEEDAKIKMQFHADTLLEDLED